MQKSSGWSLTKETSCYTRQFKALLLLRPRATAAAAMQGQPQSRSGSGSSSNGSISTAAGETEPGAAERSGGGEDANVEMVIYLVLERCCLLTESGYKVQAAAEMLDALGALTEGQPLWGWDAADEQGMRTVLKTPSGRGNDGGGRSSGVPGGATAADDDQRLPPVRASTTYLRLSVFMAGGMVRIYFSTFVVDIMSGVLSGLSRYVFCSDLD